MKKVIFVLMSFLPTLALAAAPTFSGVGDLATNLTAVINKIIPFIFAITVIFFFWGLFQFLRGSGDPKMREEGRSHMIYGILAIFVMLSIYGLIGWLQGTFNITGSETVNLPEVPTN